MTTRRVLGRVLAGALIVLFFSPPAWSVTAGAYVWVGTSKTVYRIKVGSGETTHLPISGKNVSSFTLDARHDRLWLLHDDGSVSGYRLNGSRIARLPPQTPGDQSSTRQAAGQPPGGDIAASHGSGRVYVAWDKSLHILSPNGNTLSTVQLPASITHLLVDDAKHVILAATPHDLYSFDASGRELDKFELGARFEILGLAVDRTADTLLLVLHEKDRRGNLLRAYDRRGTVRFEKRLRDLTRVIADGAGGFWATGVRNILHFDQSYRLLGSVAVQGTDGISLVSSPNREDQALWTTTATGLLRLGRRCEIQRRFKTSASVVSTIVFDNTDTTPRQ